MKQAPFLYHSFRILCASVLAFAGVFATAQCGQATWRTSTGGASGDHGYAVLAHSYGDIYVLGHTESAGSTTDIMLTKTSADGSLLWSKAIDVDGDDVGIACTEGVGGSIVIGGITDGFFTTNGDAVVLRVDTGGLVQWVTRVLPIPGYCQIRAITETADGIFVSGSVSAIGQGQTDAFIARLSAGGSLVWLNLWGGAANDHFTTIQALGDGSIVAASHYQYSSNDRRPNFMRVDINGNVLTNNEYGGSATETFTQLVRNKDGSFLGIGYSMGFGAGQRDVLITHLDSMGNYNWSSVYGTPSNERGLCGVQTTDAGWLITCKTDATSEGSLMKVDSTGALQWVRSVPDHIYGTWGNWGRNIATLADSSIVVIGTDVSTDPDGDLLLFKLNACGDLPCGQDTLTWTRTTANLVQQAVTKASVSNTTHSLASSMIIDLTSSFQANSIFQSCGGNCSIAATLPPITSCANSPTSINANVQITDGVVNFWQWDLGDGTMSSDSGMITHSFAQPGSYTVQLIVGDMLSGCLDTAYTQANIGNPVNAGQDSALVVCAGTGSFSLFTLLDPGVGAGQWIDPIGTFGANTFYPDSSISGSYLYVVPDAHCASDTAFFDIQIDICTSIETWTNGHFLLYPNPTSGTLNVSFPGAPGWVTLTLSDARGREVFRENVNGAVHQLDLDAFPKGPYLLTLRHANGVYSEPVIVE